MGNIDWAIELEEHHLFGGFDAVERDRLLEPGVSKEVKYKPGETILREGEAGNSLFLIGSGEIEVCVDREGGHRIPIYTLSKPEIFGEMALFENKPRAATVIAQKECVLLELDGAAFLEILHTHPEVEFKILSNLSDRLRRLTKEVLVAKFNDLHQKFHLLDQKVKNELDLVKNSIITAETMLTTTNQRIQEITERAKEVVESTNQSHNRIFQAIKIVGLVGGVAVIALGALGYQTWTDVKDSKDRIETAVVEAEKLTARIEKVTPKLERMETWNLTHGRKLETKFYKSIIVEDVFQQELFEGNLDGATETFNALLNYQSDPSDPSDQITEYTFNTILNNITAHEQKRKFTKRLLTKNLGKIHKFSHSQAFLMYYFLLAAHVIDGDPRYDEVREDLERYAEKYTGESIKRTLTVDFGPKNFQDYLELSEETRRIEELESREKRLSDEELESRIAAIYEDKTIEDMAYKRAEKIRDVWNIIP